jgi:transposase
MTMLRTSHGPGGGQGRAKFELAEFSGVWAYTPSTVLTQKLRDQDRAFVNFFEGCARYPKFKKKHYAQAIRYQLDQRVVAGMYRSGQLLKLPKLGELKLHWSQVPGGISWPSWSRRRSRRCQRNRTALAWTSASRTWRARVRGSASMTPGPCTEHSGA